MSLIAVRNFNLKQRLETVCFMSKPSFPGWHDYKSPVPAGLLLSSPERDYNQSSLTGCFFVGHAQ